MTSLSIPLLAAAIALAPQPALDPPKRIDVDCAAPGALERALARARSVDEVDIYLHGVCTGNFTIDRDGVTLRGATADAALATPEADPGVSPVLEIDDSRASLRGLRIRGGAAALLVRGWDAEVLLYEVDVEAPQGVGVRSSRGARVRILDSTVHDSLTGIGADSSALVNLQRVVVSHCDLGVDIYDGSFAAVSDSRIESNRVGGLNVGGRSDANVIGGVFRENGQVHVNANDWSDVALLSQVALGSETDSTPLALGANRGATIASYSSPAIHGHVSSLADASVRLGNTVIHGDLLVIQFAKAHVRDSEISGVVACVDGAEAICPRTTTAGSFGCPSASCGPPTNGAEARARTAPAPPASIRSIGPERPE